jgi:hypothetical protein
VGKSEGRNHLEDPDKDGRIILKCIFEKYDGGMDWIDVAYDRDMSLRVPLNAGNFLNRNC